jgi:hypothetical protein
MKPGDTVVIGVGIIPYIVAEVLALREDGSIKFNVINGAWTGYLDKDGTFRTAAVDNSPQHGVSVLFENVPPGLGDYNAILLWAEKELAGRPAIVWRTFRPEIGLVGDFALVSWLSPGSAIRSYSLLAKGGVGGQWRTFPLGQQFNMEAIDRWAPIHPPTGELLR